MRTASALLVCLVLIASGAPRALAADLQKADLSGEWYVLLHFKDDRSEDPSVIKFKDFAWSVKQGEKKIVWTFFPYVMFTEELEAVRREAMMSHRSWEPSPGMWDRLRTRIDVSSRANQKKTLKGSNAEGFASLPPMAAAGANMITFSRDWKVTFAPDQVRVQITDSLSGGGGLDGMEDSIVYEINERIDDGEYRGIYREAHKQGTLRMVRSEKRAVVK